MSSIPMPLQPNADVVADWGFAPTRRLPGSASDPINAAALALDAYEQGRPSASDACRDGDPRVLALYHSSRNR